VNNPPFGNAFGIAGSFPFSSAQYDVQEGIRDVSQVGVTEDPVTRSADGILLVVYHGYRIIQPPGPVAL
jgi:predicted PhzF superfamily epimerase YddE/YHI9